MGGGRRGHAATIEDGTPTRIGRMNQEELRRQIDLFEKDARQRSVGTTYHQHPCTGWSTPADKKSQPSIVGDVEYKNHDEAHVSFNHDAPYDTTTTSSTREYSIIFCYSSAVKVAALGVDSGAVVYGSKKMISAATRKKATHHHVDAPPMGQATGEDCDFLTNTRLGQAPVSSDKVYKTRTE